jgi:malate dehydrogenase
MQTVAIIGAGEIGALTARSLAALELVRAIRLIDAYRTTAAGKALDLAQAQPIDGSDTGVFGSTELADAAGADVVVLADRADGSGEWRGDDGLEVVRRLLAIAPEAPLLMAGAAQRELLALAVLELGAGRARVLGSAPAALNSAARALVGIAADCSALDVTLAVVGVPGAWVPAWTECSVASTPATAALPPHVLIRLEQQIAACWPPGAYSLAAAATHGVSALLQASRRRLTCFAALDGEVYGRPAVAAVPVTLGRTGVVRVQMPVLSPRERLSFESSLVAR